MSGNSAEETVWMLKRETNGRMEKKNEKIYLFMDYLMTF